jgi:hypothetical protein
MKSGEVMNNWLKYTYGIKKEHDIDFKDYIFNRYSIRSLTVTFRKKAMEEYFSVTDPEITHNSAAGDLPLWLFFLSKYKVRYLPVSTAMYRVLPGTGSRPVDPDKKRIFQEGVSDILEYYIRRNNLSPSFMKKLETQRTLYDMEYDATIHRTSEVIKDFFSLLARGIFSRRAFNLVLISLSKKNRNKLQYRKTNRI